MCLLCYLSLCHALTASLWPRAYGHEACSREAIEHLVDGEFPEIGRDLRQRIHVYSIDDDALRARLELAFPQSFPYVKKMTLSEAAALHEKPPVLLPEAWPREIVAPVVVLSNQQHVTAPSSPPQRKWPRRHEVVNPKDPAKFLTKVDPARQTLAFKQRRGPRVCPRCHETYQPSAQHRGAQCTKCKAQLLRDRRRRQAQERREKRRFVPYEAAMVADVQ